MVARVVGQAGPDRGRPVFAGRLLDRARRSGLHVGDLVVGEGVGVRQPQVLRDRKAEPQRAAGRARAELLVGGDGRDLVEHVEAGGEVEIEEARLGEAQVDLQALRRAGQPQAQELAAAQQVALGDGDVADDAFAGRIAGAERQLARRLLHHLDFQDDAVGCGAGPALDLHRLEEAQHLQPLLGLVDHQRVVGIAFGQAELAADDVVARAQVADDVDALDVDARALVGHVRHVDERALRDRAPHAGARGQRRSPARRRTA